MASSWNGSVDAQSYGHNLLKGTLVQLRQLQEQDLPLLARWWSDPAFIPLQQLAVLLPPVGTVVELFRSWSANGRPDAVGYSICRIDNDQLVGHVTLYGADSKDRCATLGIIIGSEHVGRAFGTDALSTMLRYGFQELGLHRIELTAWAFNDRGLRAYRTVGFVEEGRRREAVFHDGMFHDQVMLAILEQEWRSANRSAVAEPQL